MFGPRVGFIKFKADIVNEEGSFLPGIVFMRGGAVTMLVILDCEVNIYLFVERNRVLFSYLQYIPPPPTTTTTNREKNMEF